MILIYIPDIPKYRLLSDCQTCHSVYLTLGEMPLPIPRPNTSQLLCYLYSLPPRYIMFSSLTPVVHEVAAHQPNIAILVDRWCRPVGRREGTRPVPPRPAPVPPRRRRRRRRRLGGGGVAGAGCRRVMDVGETP